MNKLFFAAASTLLIVGCGAGGESAPGDETIDPLTTELTDAQAIAAAHAISNRCLSEARCYKKHDGSGANLTENETLILFKAVAAETGIPARLLKAIAYGEGLGDGYNKHYPRQFWDLDDNRYFAYRATWANLRLGLDVPLALGIDTDNPTYGIGIFQLTADRNLITAAVKKALAGGTPAPVQLYGGGRPYYNWPADHTITIDVMRAIYDPYYNILQGARLIQFKMAIYTDPQTPIHWVKAAPASDMDWALIGSTYQVYGGIGPGGGATYRIFNRMTSSVSATYRDAWLFANAPPTGN